MLFHEDHLFPAGPGTRITANALDNQARMLPTVSPHGRTRATIANREADAGAHRSKLYVGRGYEQLPLKA